MIEFLYNEIGRDKQHKADNGLVKSGSRAHCYIAVEHKRPVYISIQRICCGKQLANIFRHLIKQPEIRSENLAKI